MRCPRCSPSDGSHRGGVLINDPYGDAPQCFSCGYYHVISVDIDQRWRKEIVMSGDMINAPVDPNDWEE